MSSELYRDRDSGEITEVRRDGQGRILSERRVNNPTRQQWDDAEPSPQQPGILRWARKMKRCDDCRNQMACERADVCLHSSGRIRGASPRQVIVDDCVADLPRCNCGHLFEICWAPNCPEFPPMQTWEDFPPTV